MILNKKILMNIYRPLLYLEKALINCHSIISDKEFVLDCIEAIKHLKELIIKEDS